MRPRSFLALFALVLATTACHSRQATKALPSAAPVAAKAEAKLKAEKQVMINQLNHVLLQLRDQGIEVRKTPQKHPWRLIVPTLATADPEVRKARAQELCQNFRKDIEPLLHRKVDVEVYSDASESQVVR